MSTEERKKTGRNPDTIPAHRIPDERYAAARALYESTPGMSFAKLGQETGIHWNSLENRSRKEGGWKKNSVMPPTGMTDAAQSVADRYSAKLSNYGENVTPEERQAALAETTIEVAVDLRAQVLDRHRKEWRIIDMLLGEHVKARDFDKAKLTKITAEALAIKQVNERKAWGIDTKGEEDTSKGVTVVIERSN